ncbi:MAG: AbgT family transporter [Bacteroidales bacterium]|nr:AbgT family transporter [Bacteroidales bacterium]
MMKRIPHTFVIIGAVLLLCGVITWIVPAGEFDRQVVAEGGGTEVIVPGSYHRVESAPQTWQILGSIVEGFKRQAGIIVFILIIGGAFQILASSRAIDFGIKKFLERVHANRLVIVGSMLLFSLFGAVFGMSEETIAFVVIFVPLAISMGYDSITGLLMVYVAAHIGFSGAIFNPFTIGIAQGLSGVPLFSGFEYRIVVWVILTTLIIAFTLWWAARVKKNPALSPTFEIDSYWRDKMNEAADVDAVDSGSAEEGASGKRKNIGAWCAFIISSIAAVLFAVFYPRMSVSVGGASAEFILLPFVAGAYIIVSFFALRKSYLYYILVNLAFTIIFLIVGVLGYGWYIKEIASLFLAMGILCGMSCGFRANDICKEFLSGARDILSAALVVGLAGGIIEILTSGKVMDTILFGLAQSMEGWGKGGTVSAMYGVQTVINLFIPSGTAKAALTMPIMAPFSDIIGLSRQATIMAYQFGDGFTNMITPTSAVLMGALGVAKIPYNIWLKWWWKYLLLFMLVGLLLLLPTVYLSLSGF